MLINKDTAKKLEDIIKELPQKKEKKVEPIEILVPEDVEDEKFEEEEVKEEKKEIEQSKTESKAEVIEEAKKVKEESKKTEEQPKKTKSKATSKVSANSKK